MQTILVCDDDKEIVEAIEIYLQQEGFHVLKAYDGEEALEILKNNEVHLLIMDVMMPKLDGIRATLKIRENSSIPIIILSAKTEDSDKILGLNIGADDYVEKPFNPLELVARVKSQLRRYTQLGNAAESGDSIYTVGGLSINDDLKEVTVDGEVVKLTPIEYNILLLLVKSLWRLDRPFGHLRCAHRKADPARGVRRHHRPGLRAGGTGYPVRQEEGQLQCGRHRPGLQACSHRAQAGVRHHL